MGLQVNLCAKVGARVFGQLNTSYVQKRVLLASKGCKAIWLAECLSNRYAITAGQRGLFGYSDGRISTDILIQI